MCLAVPGKIVSIDGDNARVEYGDEEREINISMLDAKVGDYIIANAGFAIKKVGEKEALESIEMFKRLG